MTGRRCTGGLPLGWLYINQTERLIYPHSLHTLFAAALGYGKGTATGAIAQKKALRYGKAFKIFKTVYDLRTKLF